MMRWVTLSLVALAVFGLEGDILLPDPAPEPAPPAVDTNSFNMSARVVELCTRDLRERVYKNPVKMEGFVPFSKHTLVDFDASWCEHSQRFLPTFSEVADRLSHRDDVEVLHVPINKDRWLRQQLNIRTYPTLVLFLKGASEPIRFSGRRSRPNILSFVEYSAPSANGGGLGPARPPIQDYFKSTAVEPQANLVQDAVGSDERNVVAAEELVQTQAHHDGDDQQHEEADLEAVSDAVDEEDDVIALIELGVPDQPHNKMWSAKENSTVFNGPADNSLSHDVDFKTNSTVSGHLNPMNFSGLQAVSSLFSGSVNYVAIYVYSDDCEHSSCLDPVWTNVAYNLRTLEKQPDVAMVSVDSKASAGFLKEANVTTVPSFVLLVKDMQSRVRVLSTQKPGVRRKAFELVTWIQDSIVSYENPSAFTQYSQKSNSTSSNIYESNLLSVKSVGTLPAPREDDVVTTRSKAAAPKMTDHSPKPSNPRQRKMMADVQQMVWERQHSHAAGEQSSKVHPTSAPLQLQEHASEAQVAASKPEVSPPVLAAAAAEVDTPVSEAAALVSSSPVATDKQEPAPGAWAAPDSTETQAAPAEPAATIGSQAEMLSPAEPAAPAVPTAPSSSQATSQTGSASAPTGQDDKHAAALGEQRAIQAEATPLVVDRAALTQHLGQQQTAKRRKRVS